MVLFFDKISNPADRIRGFGRCSSTSTRYLNYNKVINGLKVKTRTKQNKSEIHGSGLEAEIVSGYKP